jgi:4-hydroxybutyrate dehydrogenase
MILARFSFPTPTCYGPGSISELPRLLSEFGIRRPLIVTDPGVEKTDAWAQTQTVLGPEKRSVDWFLYTGVRPNPVEDDVRSGAAAFVSGGCDGVVALGGGSPLDVGKAVRLLVKQPSLDFTRFYEQKDWSGLAPLIAIPTTAGTGSEVGRSSVITLNATKRKAVLFNPEMLARAVILDAGLTRGLPQKLTAATGVDALTHCIESYTCPAFHPLCDGIALEGVSLIVEALPRACRDGGDLDARGRMLVAAAMGAIAFQKDLGVIHSMAHALSNLFGMHHGLANALCLAPGMKFCASRKPGLYRRVGVAAGLDVHRLTDAEADAATIAFISSFLSRIGITGGLRAQGILESNIPDLAAQAFQDPCHQTNAVPVAESDLVDLFRSAL